MIYDFEKPEKKFKETGINCANVGLFMFGDVGSGKHAFQARR